MKQSDGIRKGARCEAEYFGYGNCERFAERELPGRRLMCREHATKLQGEGWLAEDPRQWRS